MNNSNALKRILLLGDELDILTVAGIALSKVGGFEVQCYSDSKKAIAEVEDCMPDLVILDMMMPNIDGMQTLAILRSMKLVAHVPVIFMTAKVQKNEIDSYLKSGASGVIQKPFDPMTLADQVREIWGRTGTGHD